VIEDYLRSTKTHPTASDVYSNVKQSLPGISLSTVYRTLSWLRDNGKAVELSDATGVSHYDGETADHGHFSCVSCHRICDVNLALPELDTTELEAETGFRVQGRRTELFGFCSQCGEREDK